MASSWRDRNEAALIQPEPSPPWGLLFTWVSSASRCAPVFEGAVFELVSLSEQPRVFGGQRAGVSSSLFRGDLDTRTELALRQPPADELNVYAEVV